MGVGVTAWVRKEVYGWDSLDCCCKVCVCGEYVCGCHCDGVGVIVWVGVGVIEWVRKGVSGWNSLDCCHKVCVCWGEGGRGEGGVCGCDCVCEEGSVWMGQP